jgi:hypothetical protein
MHLKVFVKLKKNPKNPLVCTKKTKKKTKKPKKPKKNKKPKKTQKNPLGWVLKKKPVFSNPADPGSQTHIF